MLLFQDRHFCILFLDGYKYPVYAYCRLCSSHFSILHGGYNDLKRHVAGSMHQQRFKDSSSSIRSFSRENTTTHTREVTLAEVRLVQFIARHNISFQAADHLSQLFPILFPDSKIAASFGCGHTKTKAIYCDALDPHFKKPVIGTAMTQPFSLLCDESNDKGAQVKLLTILIRLSDAQNGFVVTHPLETIGPADLTASGIFAALENALHKYNIQFNIMLSFASDTCDVMKGVKKGVVAHLREKQPKVIDIHCACHLVSLTVKAAIKILPLKVDEVLVDIYYH